MTDESRGLGGTVGPPWSVDVLADLHAGVLDEREAAELWPRVNADAEARAIIEALEATTADLNALGSAPVEPMPAEFAARLDAAIAGEAQRAFGGQPQQAPADRPVAPVVDLAAARRKRNKLLGWGTGLVAAAAAAVVAVAVIVPGGGSGSDVAQPPPTSLPGQQPGGEPPLALKKNDLGGALSGPQGVQDFGPLGNEEKLDACLAANGIDPSLRPVKVRPVTLDGKPGVMVLFTTGKLAQFRLVVLSPTCGPNEPGKLADELIGAK
ncbi:hypothetical protein [Amycolatopsis sp. CA-230715]|uniref:hypothetical protein n=1 Tax=Amycolatopsis sp. CA-230715 TaxID=2745196 RepID=UPI001C01ACC7|nr:hypothetical protein [Amycolatopsis sp. CA-230715]QWF80489.1 hypothetical protein HUW46_03912 [Amycolatopsis sp. CA-230715]